MLESSWGLTPPPHHSNFISFPDGDMVLRSSDDVEFRVDSVILRRASGFFSDLAQIPTPEGTNGDEPIPMAESSEMLDLLLRLLYPVGTTAPNISTRAQGEALLHAVQKFRISSHAVEGAVASYLQSLEPLQHWALAIQFHLYHPQVNAVMRFMLAKEDGLDGDFPELDNVTARALANLLHMKQNATSKAKEELSGLIWSCPSHEDEDWCTDQMSLIEESPFDRSLSSDSELLNILEDHGCSQCLQRFHGGKATRQRERVQSTVETLLTRAILGNVKA